MDKNNLRKDYPTTSKKPPKLKIINRCKSVAIDNYTPGSLDDSIIFQEQIIPRPIKSSSEINSENYNDNFYHTQQSIFRRSDTINSGSNLQLRKTNSFHINKTTPEKLSLSRRTSSVRGVSLLVPNEIKKIRSPSPSRRGHQSFRDTSRHSVYNNKITLEGLQRQPFIDDILENHPEKLQVVCPINISLENEFKRPKTKSHTIIDDNSMETRYGSDILHRKKSHELSTNNLDQQQINLKRGGKYGYSLYLSPDSLEELQVHRSIQGFKKTHSASMCVRPYRKSLNTTKKSKSFIVDTYPEYTLVPPVPDNRILTNTELKRSPRLSASTLIDEKRASLERISSIRPYEMHDVDFNSMLVPFHQSRRKSSVIDSSKKMRKQSVSNNIHQDIDSDRKRKNIACIIMTVLLCLVCASVFVVSITLTHSSGSPVQNQTRKVYTFTRESPIHYNVRQENERLMQESMLRLKITKNFTDSAVVSLGLGIEGVP